jgi:hypothetical protein
MTTVILNLVAVNNLRRKASEPEVRKILRETQALARRWPGTGNPAWTTATHKLAPSIQMTFTGGVNASGTVGSKLRYAAAAHNGTKARIIYARRGKYMKFRWKRKGNVIVWREYVKHPAVRGSFFLTRPLSIVAKRHGFAVRAVRLD